MEGGRAKIIQASKFRGREVWTLVGEEKKKRANQKFKPSGEESDTMFADEGGERESSRRDSYWETRTGLWGKYRTKTLFS